MTYRELIAGAEARLADGPHPARARLDAQTLLRSVLQQDRAWLLAHLDGSATPAVIPTFAERVARRQVGEPIQYITGETEFFGLPFTVTPDVLIPRPETEHLVEEVLRLAKSLPKEISIADIGTGSGAVAIALARALPNAKVTATDISAAALKIARRNAKQNQVSDRIDLLEGNLLEPLAGRSFHILASNPPYIPTHDLDSLSVEVRDHEPHTALFAGPDGLAIYQRLIPAARPLLLPGGFLVLEIGFGQQPAIQHLLSLHGYTNFDFVPDYQGIPRVAIASA